MTTLELLSLMRLLSGMESAMLTSKSCSQATSEMK